MISDEKKIFNSTFIKRIYLTFNDLLECKWCIDYLKEKSNAIIEKYLIIAYMRPFSGNDKFDLPPESMNLFTSKEKELQIKLREYRNTIIAHSSFEAYEPKLKIYSIESLKENFDQILMKKNQYLNLEQDLCILECMCIKLEEFCFKKIEILKAELPDGDY